jgi:hypothetical protein
MFNHINRTSDVKTVAFIAGKSENQAAKFFFIHFSIDNISFYALSWLKLNFGCYLTFEIIFKALKPENSAFLCKLQDLTDSAIPFPGDFVIIFTSNNLFFWLLGFEGIETR